MSFLTTYSIDCNQTKLKESQCQEPIAASNIWLNALKSRQIFLYFPNILRNNYSGTFQCSQY